MAKIIYLVCFWFSLLGSSEGQSITMSKDFATIEQHIMENIRRPVLTLVQAYIEKSRRDLDAVREVIGPNGMAIKEVLNFKNHVENTLVSNEFEKQLKDLNESLTAMMTGNIQRNQIQMMTSIANERELLLQNLNETLDKMDTTNMKVQNIQLKLENSNEEVTRLSYKWQDDFETVETKIADIQNRFEIYENDLKRSLWQNITLFNNESLMNAISQYEKRQLSLFNKVSERMEELNVTLRDHVQREYDMFSDNIKNEINYEKIISEVEQISQRIQNETQGLWTTLQFEFNRNVDAAILRMYQNVSQLRMFQQNSFEQVKRQLREERIKTLELTSQINNLTRTMAEISATLNDVKTRQQNSETRIDEMQKINQETQRNLATLSGNITELVTKEDEDVGTILTDCRAIFLEGQRASGIYMISPDGIDPFRVYCDMTEGGWTLLQRRVDGSLNFTRPWSEYVNGFGNLSSEFWLGLEYIHRLSRTSKRVMFELQLISGPWKKVVYTIFQVHDSSHFYSLHVAGHVFGLKARTFTYNDGQKFWTYDRDNSNRCASKRNGGWWYDNCTYLNINGKYNLTNSESGMTEHCCSQRYNNLKKTIMKIQ